jgi:RHS repeat-associated protein
VDTYIYNKADQLTSMEKRNTSNQQLLESYSYSYDNLGQMDTKTKTSVNPNEVTEYEYYVGGNLQQVTLPDDSEITFLYDAYGNRIQKATPEEVITYQYAMGSLRREIHKEDTNTTTIYTLNYYPWGFEKVVPAQGEDPQVTTPYYYVYDQKGFVQAILDVDGDIVESYEYTPFGELLTTPTITQFRFLSGREECIWDPETKLYYMHARYYDPILGRFQTQDSMRGSMGSPVSLNRYIYCQNDPISLIDPSGNSPFNTGLPPRGLEPSDQSIIDFTDSCTLPEVAGGGGNEILSNQNDACYIVYTDGVSQWIYITLPNGVVVKITGLRENSDGNIFLLPIWSELTIEVVSGETDKNHVETIDFIAGLEAGLRTLISSGISLTDLCKVAANVTAMKDYFDEFCKITGRIRGARYGYEKGCAASEFMKHAVIGGYIATKMKKDNKTVFYVGDLDTGKYDTIIGFWVSYWVEKYKWNIGLETTGIGDGSDILGLVDIALFMKSLMYKENGKMNPNATNTNKDGSVDYGLTMINKNGVDYFHTTSMFEGMNFKTDDLWKTNPFYNIGFGMGILFYKSVEGKRSGHVQSLADWIENANDYNRGDPRGYKTLWYFQRAKRKYIKIKWPYIQPPDDEIPPYEEAP